MDACMPEGSQGTESGDHRADRLMLPDNRKEGGAENRFRLRPAGSRGPAPPLGDAADAAAAPASGKRPIGAQSDWPVTHFSHIRSRSGGVNVVHEPAPCAWARESPFRSETASRPELVQYRPTSGIPGPMATAREETFNPEGVSGRRHIPP